MPIASAMNLMGYQGEKPWIQQNEERDLAMAQGKANLGQSLSDLEMQRMQTDALKERQGLLKSFEGRTDSPEFQKKMMSVDPDLVMRMSEHASKLDKRQQDMLKERFKKLAVRATLDDTEEKWNQTGWKQPFSDRNSIISMGATMDQALQMTTGGQSGTAMMRNHAFLTNMGFDPKTAINMLTKSREETAREVRAGCLPAIAARRPGKLA